MARIRTVKPEFFTHEGLFDLEQKIKMPARLAFEGLWCHADRDGRFEWRPRRLKQQILPYDEIDFSAILDALADAGFVQKYQVAGNTYGSIPTWLRHQKPHHKEEPSRLPAPPEQIVQPCMDHGRGMDEPCLDQPRPEKMDVASQEGKGMENRKGTENGARQTCLNGHERTDFEESPEGIAQAWCFYSTRRRLGASRDSPLDIAGEFKELIRLGHDPKVLLKTVLDPSRDRGEHFWQFKEREKRNGKADTPAAKTLRHRFSEPSGSG